MVSAGISLTIPKEAFAINENKMTINEMIAQMLAEARRLGYGESSIWTNIQPGLRAFAICYSKKGIQQRTGNTHEPLVSQEIFDGANAKILSRKHDTTNNFVSVFSGLVKCGTCGKALGLRYWGRDRHRIYVCTTYAHNTKACADHRIYYEDLYNAVLADIQHHAALLLRIRRRRWLWQ